MNFAGDGDFIAVGEHFFDHFVKVGGLMPHHRVLDIGSGVGRMAIPLTKYLTDGSYEGFDVVDVGVEWCRHHITPKHPNFRFRVADVFNRGYNPQGGFMASEYRFPFPSKSFDFVFLTSVFTHMMPADVENYLAEIARVLRVGGRCMATCFVHTAETAALTDTGSAIQFRTWLEEGCWVINPDLPEDAVCFPEGYLVRQFQRRGLKTEPVYLGSWSGRSNTLTTHDVIVATKTRDTRRPVLEQLGMGVFFALRRALRRTSTPSGTWRGATESGVTRARAHAILHPEDVTGHE
jgi:SAM-dependent methyltransferase